MDKSPFRELNTLLKGEQMAVEAYEKLIQAAEDDKIKNELQNIQMEHKVQAGKLAERVQTLGGRPDYTTGITGTFANAKLLFEARSKKHPVDILKMAYDGEDKGIAAAEKLIEADIDKESKSLINDILSNDHDHLKSMLSMITKYDYEK
jgi:bacterioferritin